MAEINAHEPGMFNWVDLMTTDAEGARSFYSQLLGLESYDNPAGGGFFYTMLTRNGKNVAGLFQMTPDMLGAGMRPCWNSYIAVANVEESAAKAAELGGAVVAPPMDVMDAGRMASVADTTGAGVGLWEAKEHIGTQLIGEPGAFAWTELYTRDAAAAAAFYGGLFGWTRQEAEGANGIPYNVFMLGESPVAGMLAIRPEWGEVPLHWAVYFVVERLERALEQVKAMGGRVEAGSMSVPNIGTFAPVTDPQGAFLMLIELAEN